MGGRSSKTQPAGTKKDVKSKEGKAMNGESEMKKLCDVKKESTFFCKISSNSAKTGTESLSSKDRANSLHKVKPTARSRVTKSKNVKNIRKPSNIAKKENRRLSGKISKNKSSAKPRVLKKAQKSIAVEK